jgi:tripartite-type tricarboxylate transporter receptor subunit TctC
MQAGGAMTEWSMRLAVAAAVALTARYGVVAAAAQAQRAQSFPSRAIKIIVPFPAGGPTDLNIRIIAQRMSEDWKQPVVIENRPGANNGHRGPGGRARGARRLYVAGRHGPRPW